MATVTPLRRSQPSGRSSGPSLEERFRQLFVSLDLPLEPYPIIGVTSSVRGEGRTTVALGLARTLAHDLDEPVVLIEADLEQPSLAQKLEIPNSPGLVDVLEGTSRLESLLHPAEENLFVVPAGNASAADAGRLLRRLPEVAPFDSRVSLPGVVVMDLPPIVNSSYAAIAASASDAVVLVVGAGATPIHVVREAVSRLQDKPPAGIVLNGTHTSIPKWLSGLGA